MAEGPDLVVRTTQEQLDSMDQIVRDMHTRSGLLEAIEASTLTLEDAGRPDPRIHQDPRPGARDGSTVRQLHRHRPPVPGRATSLDRELVALPVRRRVGSEGALPALVPEGVQGRATQENYSQGSGRHSRVDRRARVLPEDHLRSRPLRRGSGGRPAIRHAGLTRSARSARCAGWVRANRYNGTDEARPRCSSRGCPG